MPKSMFDGLRLPVASAPRPAFESPPVKSELEKAVAAFARAWQDMNRMREMGLPVLEYQQRALRLAAARIDRNTSPSRDNAGVVFADISAQIINAFAER